MVLKLVKYHPQFAYSVGDEFTVNEKDTKILLEGGYAMPVGQKVETPESNTVPAANASIQLPKHKKQQNRK